MDVINFAISKHHNQTYGDTYYIRHLIHVSSILLSLNTKQASYSDIITAGWLHDILEDTNTSYSELKTNFGENVANLVYLVTNEIGKNRQEIWEKTKTKISTDVKAVIIKVADRIANIEYSLQHKNKQKFNMYISEKESFNFINIYSNDEYILHKDLKQMWKHLNNLYTLDINTCNFTNI